MLRAYTYKLVHSSLTYISVLGVLAICLTFFLFDYNSNDHLVMHVEFFLNINAYRKAIAIFAALPFTANFADEWHDGVTNHCITRNGIKKYALANSLFCATTSFLAVFLGLMIFAISLSFSVPIYWHDSNPVSLPFGILLENDLPWIYLITEVFVFSCSISMWCMLGLLLSAFLPNKYVAICSPLVASYVVERITMNLPDAFNLWYLSLTHINLTNPWFAFLYMTGVFLALSVVCGIVFYFVLRKRVQNEVA